MRSVVAVLLLPALLVTLPLSGCKRAKRIAAQAAGSVGVSQPTYTDAIQQAISTGHMDALKWPDYSDVQAAVSGFYDSRDYTLAWSKDGKPTAQANELMQAFSNARKRGLEPEDYDASRWQGRVAALSSDDGKVAFDTAMTVNAMRFLNAIHMGRTDPKFFAFGIDSSSKQLDLPTVLTDQIASASEVDKALTDLEPQSAQYKALRDQLPHYLDLAAQDHSDPLPSPGTSAASLSRSYPGLAALQQKLQLLGDLQGGTDNTAANSGADASPSAAPGTSLDLATLTDGVKHFQHRHGLPEDGKLSQATVAALNVPITTRVNEIEDAMERWRWLPDQYQQPAILVNLPEFVLRAFEGDTQQFNMRVVVGQSKEDEHHTPMIADQMKYLVFRPFWNIPPSIAKKEILGHMQADPGYLSSHNFEAVNSKGEEVPASAEAVEHSTVMVREKPGPKNSLGLVKFMFPNPFNVYLHDTNAHYLFARNRRDYSHGCVRVEDPPKLADWLLRDNSKWDPDTIQQTMNDDTVINKTVSLGKSVPVVLFYGTAYVDGGEMHFFQDLYGYDADLEKELQHGYPFQHKPGRARGEASV
ncbi:L,D-transpeptidase family protein [Terriglobus aquaticus]|uniref:Murein L,D-transpeptidase n=1 Tax=Terriglobus aquaticus TaxID=940139 RepID=A0ABW9KHE7_9BACT|nr:L,D-transpeptidase family protein [Terriglobus aquaticus]